MTITVGITSSSFDVNIIDNIIQDGDKTFTVTIRLITCLSVTINSNTATVAIIDDEGTVNIFESTAYLALIS